MRKIRQGKSYWILGVEGMCTGNHIDSINGVIRPIKCRVLRVKGDVVIYMDPVGEPRVTSMYSFQIVAKDTKRQAFTRMAQFAHALDNRTGYYNL